MYMPAERAGSSPNVLIARVRWYSGLNGLSRKLQSAWEETPRDGVASEGG